MQKPNQLANSAKRWLARTARFLVLLVPTLTLAQSAHAAWWNPLESLGKWAADTVGTANNVMIKTMLLAVEFVVGGIFAAVLAFAQGMTTFVIKGGNILLASDPIKQAWDIMLLTTNSLLALALAIMAVLIMTGAQNYNIKKALTALIGAIVVANLSYTIVLALVALGDALRDAIVFAFSQAGVTQNPAQEWLDTMGSFFQPSKDMSLKDLGDDVSGALLRTVISLATLGIGAFVMFKVAFVLIERSVRLALAIVVAPLVFVLQLFPGAGLEGLSKNWWSDVIKWVLVYPGIYLLLSIAGLLTSGHTVNLNEAVTGLAGGRIDGGESFWSELMLSIAAISITLGVGNIPGLLGLKATASEGFFGKTALPLAKNALTLGAQSVALKNPGGIVGKTLDFKDRYFKPAAERIKANREQLQELKGSAEFSRAIGSSSNLFAAKQAARERYFNQRRPQVFPTRANNAELTSAEQDFLENESGYQNLPEVKAFERNKKIIKSHGSKLREKFADRNLDAEEAENELDKKIQLRNQLAARNENTAEVDADILGLALHIQSKAAQGGTASVPWKDKANAAFFGANAAILRNAGFQAPKTRYTYSAKSKRDYEDTLGPRGVDLLQFDQMHTDLSAAQGDLATEDAAITAAQQRIDAEQLALRNNATTTTNQINDIRTRGDAELADALQELQQNGQLEQMVTNVPLRTAIGQITNASIAALNALDQQTHKGLMDIASDTNISAATKASRIRALLNSNASMRRLGAPQIDALTNSIGGSNGAFLQRGNEARTILERAANPAISPVVRSVMSAPARARVTTNTITQATTARDEARARRAQAEGRVTASTVGLNQIETRVGEHPGYVQNARTLAPADQTAVLREASSSIARSTNLGIDPQTGASNANDRMTLRELVANGTLQQADVVREHANLVQRMGLTTGAVRGREDLDVSNVNNWMQLTNAQRRDVVSKIWASNRSLLDNRHGQLPPSPGRRQRP